jgi:hypothetical protein
VRTVTQRQPCLNQGLFLLAINCMGPTACAFNLKVSGPAGDPLSGKGGKFIGLGVALAPA